jgi:hypothetical protein
MTNEKITPVVEAKPVTSTDVPSSQPAPTQSALSDLRRVIADDTLAVSFQSLGQYRTALLKSIDTLYTIPTAPPVQEPVANAAFSGTIRRLREDHHTWRDSIDRCLEAAELLEKHLAPAALVPEHLDVRRIMLAIVPGDGSGHEVYAKSVDEVVNTLTELSERIEVLEAEAKAAQTLTVIDPNHWVPCSPEWITKGGNCATAPRLWNAVECNHYHPTVTQPPVVDLSKTVR